MHMLDRPDLHERTLQRDGSVLHYWLTGPDERPLVVLTHGATMDHRMFDAQVAALAPEYRVLTWDVRGHGRSQPLGSGFSVHGAARDLLAILDQLGATEAALVGQSLGGNIAQEIALIAPERVTALALLGCACNTLKLSAIDNVLLRLSTPLLALYPTERLRRTIAERVAITPAVQAYALEGGRQVSRRDFLTIWAALPRCLHEEPGYRIRQPLLLMHGAHDNLGNFKQSYPIWAARDTHGAFAVIPNAGHNANQDNPDYFNALLLAFLRERLPTSEYHEQDKLPRAAVN
jgi:pimeloyl-ACP methyl ester carboxylesterase